MLKKIHVKIFFDSSDVCSRFSLSQIVRKCFLKKLGTAASVERIYSKYICETRFEAAVKKIQRDVFKCCTNTFGSSSHSFTEGCISSKLLLECALKCTKFNLPVDFTRKKGKCCCQQNDDKNKHFAIIKGKIICL